MEWLTTFTQTDGRTPEVDLWMTFTASPRMKKKTGKPLQDGIEFNAALDRLKRWSKGPDAGEGFAYFYWHRHVWAGCTPFLSVLQHYCWENDLRDIPHFEWAFPPRP